MWIKKRVEKYVFCWKLSEKKENVQCVCRRCVVWLRVVCVWFVNEGGRVLVV